MVPKSAFAYFIIAVCNAIPQDTVIPTETVSATPTPTPISWDTKVDDFRSYVLQQPDRNATRGFWQGPAIQKTYPDSSCLQIRFYNWDCNYEIPYKMRGVIKWLDGTNIRKEPDAIWDKYRYYTYGRYVDPDDGWDFYGEARLSFGACGNRGPQSSCGVGWCVNATGVFPGTESVPTGVSPYVDPNNKDNLCPWLRDNGTVV